MIYIVSWNERKGPQSLFFNSPGSADFFAYRLLRSKRCRNVVITKDERELKAA